MRFSLDDSPQKKNISNIIGPGDYVTSVYSPNVSYSLSSDEYGSPAYRGKQITLKIILKTFRYTNYT